MAMSGGVDSSVAACLLAGQGRPIVGFSMQLVNGLAGETERYGRCCSPDDFDDARSVADRLGFPHYVIDMEREFLRNGFQYGAAQKSQACKHKDNATYHRSSTGLLDENHTSGFNGTVGNKFVDVDPRRPARRVPDDAVGSGSKTRF